MRRTTRWRAAAATAALGVLLAGCGSDASDGDATAEEAVTTPAVAASPSQTEASDDAGTPADEPSDEPTAAPIEVDGSERPRVTWDEVDGAVGYRLTVLPDDGPTWAWSGEGTAVVLGGGDEPDGGGVGWRLDGPAVVTVTAHDEGGTVLRLDQVRVGEG